MRWLETFRDNRRAFRAVLLAAALFALAGDRAAQTECLKPGRVNELKAGLTAAPAAAPDEALSKELVDLSTALIASTREALPAGNRRPDALNNATIAKTRERVCQILNASPWPSIAAVKPEGSSAFMYLVARALTIQMQAQLYPVVVEAYRLEQIEKNEFLASYLDRLQLAFGAAQLFGTQAFLRDGLLVLAPFDSRARVEQRRREFKMEPLRTYERALESSYMMPLVRSVGVPDSPADASVKQAAVSAPATSLSSIEADEEVIKVATSLVSLDVVVSDPQAAPLEKGDFRIFENDRPVEIESFARADSPFDIVLLLDLSGSTERRSGLIRRSTRRFIEMKRPVDRIAVVTFSDTQTVVSPLEADKQVLLKSLKDLDGGGGSLVWDSVKFAQDMLDRSGEPGRRKAIVLMTDGLDNSLNFSSRSGSRSSFADLVESVQRGTASIFPIYLEIEPRGPTEYSRRLIANAQRTLQYLADQSAGTVYTAEKLEDLANIYDRVLKDVGTVYSVGFTSPDQTNTRRWRSLKVQVPARPGVKLRHRPGYFPVVPG